jgi:hypothetical protein
MSDKFVPTTGPLVQSNVTNLSLRVCQDEKLHSNQPAEVNQDPHAKEANYLARDKKLTVKK